MHTLHNTTIQYNTIYLFHVDKTLQIIFLNKKSGKNARKLIKINVKIYIHIQNHNILNYLKILILDKTNAVNIFLAYNAYAANRFLIFIFLLNTLKDTDYLIELSSNAQVFGHL